MLPKLESMRLITDSYGRSIRLDWSNDRHHAVTIEEPLSQKQVAYALHRLAYIVETDDKLEPNK